MGPFWQKTLSPFLNSAHSRADLLWPFLVEGIEPSLTGRPGRAPQSGADVWYDCARDRRAGGGEDGGDARRADVFSLETRFQIQRSSGYRTYCRPCSLAKRHHQRGGCCCYQSDRCGWSRGVSAKVPVFLPCLTLPCCEVVVLSTPRSCSSPLSFRPSLLSRCIARIRHLLWADGERDGLGWFWPRQKPGGCSDAGGAGVAGPANSSQVVESSARSVYACGRPRARTE